MGVGANISVWDNAREGSEENDATADEEERDWTEPCQSVMEAELTSWQALLKPTVFVSLVEEKLSFPSYTRGFNEQTHSLSMVSASTLGAVGRYTQKHIHVHSVCAHTGIVQSVNTYIYLTYWMDVFNDIIKL